MPTLIKNAHIVNEGKTTAADIRIASSRIEKIASSIAARADDQIIDAQGKHLLPGMIDDQVHFREPGLTHKGDIASESAAAVAGGITSYMEMPNVNPATTTIEALEKKYAIAQEKSMANYSFYLGATEDNLEQIKRLDPKRHPGVKVFMGASTGDLLVEAPQALDAIFANCPTLIVTHCESGPVIKENLSRLVNAGKTITIHEHPIIRDAEACYASSSYAVDLAKHHKSQLHVLHITTEKELSLFTAGPVAGKNITAEACVHHLWFSNDDYARLGTKIKCNPAIKYASDRDAILAAVNNDVIDIIATDHAPHTLEEKSIDAAKAPAGLPLVEHALLTLLDHVTAGRLSLEKVVEKVCHNPAIRYGVNQRGFLREGYYADLALVDLNKATNVSDDTVRYKCGWSPFSGHTFKTSIAGTWINGEQVYDGTGFSTGATTAQRLEFNG